MSEKRVYGCVSVDLDEWETEELIQEIESRQEGAVPPEWTADRDFFVHVAEDRHDRLCNFGLTFDCCPDPLCQEVQRVLHPAARKKSAA